MKKEIPKNVKGPLTFGQRLAGFRMVGEFISIKVETLKLAVGDWRWIGTREHHMFAYYCPKCGDRLSEGPSGGGSVNCVCHQCKVNYGTLPNNEWE